LLKLIYPLLRVIRIYLRYFINSAKVHLYYNDTFFVLLGALARDCVAVAAIYFITYRFYNIGGWEMGELLFLYSLLYISYGLGMLFFAGVRDVETSIEQGTFDRYMITPLSIFFQAIIARVDLLTTFSYCFLGVILFNYSANMMDIHWSFQSGVFLMMALLGGMLIQVALLLLGSLWSFWTVKTGNVKFLMFFNIRALSIYPINIYPKGLRYVLTFILPFAFVNYFPAKYLLAKKDGIAVSGFYSYGSMFIGVILFLAVYFIWRLGIRNYKSTGS
jgi:ABC-2 type transport system permease protein